MSNPDSASGPDSSSDPDAPSGPDSTSRPGGGSRSDRGSRSESGHDPNFPPGSNSGPHAKAGPGAATPDEVSGPDSALGFAVDAAVGGAGAEVEPSSRSGAATAAARLVTEVLAPWVIVLLLPVAMAWQVTRSPSESLLWGFVIALTSSLLPMLVIVWGVRAGRWDGHHVRNREDRLVPFLALIGLSLAGLALLVLGGAPWPMIALDLSMIVSLLVTGAITTRWKISMHTAVAAGAVVIATTYVPALWVLAALVAVIGWSRVQVGDHTPAQVVAGAVIGAVLGGGLFTALLWS